MTKSKRRMTLAALTCAAGWLAFGGARALFGGDSSSFNWKVVTGLQQTGVQTNAAGLATVSYNQSGNSTNQVLGFQASRLTTGSTHFVSYVNTQTVFYVRALQRGSDHLSDVGTFNTDRSGFAYQKYFLKSCCKISTNKHNHTLPIALDPLTDILHMSIGNGTNELLVADFTIPSRFTYSMQQTLASTGVEPGATGDFNATGEYITLFRMAGSTPVTQVLDVHDNCHVNGFGLTPLASYSIAANGIIATNAPADAKGQLRVQNFFPSALDFLELRSIDVLNTDSISVLHVSLPGATLPGNTPP